MRLLTRAAFTMGGPSSDLERERLLDVDVFARVQRVDADGRVPVIGRGDQDGIHLLHLEHLAVIGEVSRVGADLLRLIDLVVADVAKRDNVHARVSRISTGRCARVRRSR